MKVQIFESFDCSGEISPNSCHFWNNRSVFLQILHQFSGSWDITLLYFFSLNFIYFQQKEPAIKVRIWWNFTCAAKRLKICTLKGSFYPNHVQFQLKKYRRVISHDTEKSDAKFKEKLTCSFKHREFAEFPSNHLKVWKFQFNRLFLSKV